MKKTFTDESKFEIGQNLEDFPDIGESLFHPNFLNSYFLVGLSGQTRECSLIPTLTEVIYQRLYQVHAVINA